MTFNAGLFNRVAGQYDEKPPFFSVLGQLLVDFAQLPHGSQVLDVGAGRGAVARAALDAVGHDGQVAAVDVAERMVEHLRGLGRSNLRVHHADVESLPLPSSSVDHAVSGFTVHIVSDLESALREVHRVLRPGGTFCWSMPGDHPDAREWQEAYGQIYARFRERLDETPTEMSGANDMGSAISACAFDVAEETQTEVAIPVGSAEAYWDWTQTHGARWLTDALVDAGDDQSAMELRVAVLDSLERLHPTKGRDIMVAPLFVRMSQR